MSSSPFYEAHMMYEKGVLIPLLTALCYKTAIHVYQPSVQQSLENRLKRKQQKKPSKVKWNAITILIFIHNLFLCTFSLICFLRTFPIVFNLFTTHGLTQGICMLKYEYGMDKAFGYWGYLFYLSKYYEMIDSFIVIYKGRRPIALQVYHHMGAVIGCGWHFTDQSCGAYIFIVPNSFIHTIMYGFYALSTIKIHVPLKYVITLMQMLQFVIGMTCILYQLFVVYPKNCMTENEYYLSLYHLFYISWLFYKFMMFYVDTYHEKGDEKKKK